MTIEQIPQIMDFVRRRIRDEHPDIRLEEHEYHLDDEWLYLEVSPSKPGTRASDYAKDMADIEKDLRAHHFENVLLMPTIEE